MPFLNPVDYGASTVQNHIVYNEVPSGSVDGVNTVFTSSNPVLNGLIDVYLNGARQKGGGEDYVFTAPDTITFNIAPPVGSIILIDYIK